MPFSANDKFAAQNRASDVLYTKTYGTLMVDTEPTPHPHLYGNAIATKTARPT